MIDAIRDAQAVLARETFPIAPLEMPSSEGTITLQWRKEGRGVALIFAGDGMVSVAFRGPGQSYTDAGLECAVNDPLPREFWNAVTQVAA